MILIYSQYITARLEYITSFLFTEVLGLKAVMTTNPDEFIQAEGAKINYTDSALTKNEIRVQPSGLLFKTSIKEQHLSCNRSGKHVSIYQSHTEGAYPFDLFSASFYLLTRYEEYLPHMKDAYGRYAHENAIAYREGFLNQPLINYWIEEFAETLHARFPGLQLSRQPFVFIPTFDIDIAYAYKGKGLMRNIAGGLQELRRLNIKAFIERLSVMLNKRNDPYDLFDWIANIHNNNTRHLIIFILVAANNGRYDKNILPHKSRMKDLIQQLQKKHAIGLHPSWQSGDKPYLLAMEKKLLETVAGKPIQLSRQHYIRFNLPAGYRNLLANNITADYSMGYGSINGFRASVAHSFPWFDLEKDEQTALRIHPFCYMDANSIYEQKLSAEESSNEFRYYYDCCRNINGPFISIMHNHIIGDKRYAGWKDMYQAFLEEKA